MDVARTTFTLDEVKKLMLDTLPELADYPIDLAYEIRRRFEPIGYNGRLAERAYFLPPISYTIMARGDSVSAEVVRRIVMDTGAATVRHVRRVVQGWVSEQGANSALVDVTKDATKEKFRLRLVLGQAKIRRALSIVEESTPGSLFYQTSLGWVVKTKILNNPPRINNIASQIVAECCRPAVFK
jgi:hypothetical protein